jgi:hypothetical protein
MHWTYYDPAEELTDEYGHLPQNVVMRDNFVLERTESANCFVYCLSQPLSREVMVKTDASYDTVAEIDLAGFFRSLGEFLQLHGHIIGPSWVANCYYSDVIEHRSDAKSAPPAICKHTRFAFQREMRMIYTPVADHIQPISIQCSDLTRFCRLVSEKELDAAASPPPTVSDTLKSDPRLAKWSGYSMVAEEPGAAVKFYDRFLRRPGSR